MNALQVSIGATAPPGDGIQRLLRTWRSVEPATDVKFNTPRPGMYSPTTQRPRSGPTFHSLAKTFAYVTLLSRHSQMAGSRDVPELPLSNGVMIMVRKRLCKLIAASALALRLFHLLHRFTTSRPSPRRRSRHAVQAREGGSHLLRRQHASRPHAAFWVAGDADLQPLSRPGSGLPRPWVTPVTRSTTASVRRLRSPDEWLTREKADVIFAFFGFNESFTGPKGLTKFKSEHDKSVKDDADEEVQRQGRRGSCSFRRSRRRDLKNPNLPDGKD